MIRILIIDEQQSALNKTCSVLKAHKDFEIVGTGGKDLYSVFQLVQFKAYDIVVFDWLSKHSEIENRYIIHSISLSTSKALIVLTDHEDEAHICKALETNIRGYLLKKTDLAMLPDSIRQITQDNIGYINHKIALKATMMYSKILQKRYISDHSGVTPLSIKPSSIPQLSKNELHTLLFVFKGYKYKEIAQNLQLCEGTIRNYYYTGTKKAGLRNRRDLAAFIHRYGLNEYPLAIEDKV
ncbi:MAG: response regulator transcription factor [Spirochaetaceae bacterium]|nr:response regulator transcription factor [Spirochaetaceae bacterium]